MATMSTRLAIFYVTFWWGEVTYECVFNHTQRNSVGNKSITVNINFKERLKVFLNISFCWKQYSIVFYRRYQGKNSLLRGNLPLSPFKIARKILYLELFSEVRLFKYTVFRFKTLSCNNNVLSRCLNVYKISLQSFANRRLLHHFL